MTTNDSTYGCAVRVGSHWTQLWLLLWFIGAPLIAVSLLLLLGTHLPFWLSIVIAFAAMIAMFAVPIVFFAKRPHDTLSVDTAGLTLTSRGQLPLSSIRSYDASSFTYGNRGRMYLVIRPQAGTSLIIRPASRQRPAFASLCQQLAVICQQLGATGAAVPIQRSFWGSRGAKWMGIGGLALIAGVILEALALMPAQLFFAIPLAVVGAPIFLGMVRGKRPLN